MFLRQNKLQVELPQSPRPDANAAAAMQELLGGRFGEMTALNHYLFQSFNFRGKKKLKPFYDLVCCITAEKMGHVELASAAINMTLAGSSAPVDPGSAPLREGLIKPDSYFFIGTGQTSLVSDSMGKAWSGDNVCSSGNLVLDLLQNFFLESGARTQKMRVYEMTDHPTARAMIGYLLVRGGAHVLANAKALEIATGVDMKKLIPIPNLSNEHFETARKYEAMGLGNKLYTFSPSDYEDAALIWCGQNPQTGAKLEMIQGAPEGASMPDLTESQEAFAPGVSHDDFLEIAGRLKKNVGL
ncbi:manganese catalase family protein [Paenibacillus sp. HB172176]|uniref:manganese catalase family protein n=1 Tax=Paenibacillus sp. HB172176 TaxID=2493690 RepID=UPI00143B0C5C|nr:manganese catalase family protein [Paenibacillus sp. HB172176]